MKKLLNSLAAIAMAASLTACSSSKSSAYSGTTKGTAKGMGDVTVTLTLKDGKITECSVDGAGETEGIGTNAIDQLPGEIVKENKISVDGVTGATITSDAIKDAAKAALEAAGLDASDYE